MDNKLKIVGATGLASTAALMVATVPAVAGEVYFGISGGVASGDAPLESESSHPEEYALHGLAAGMFIGMMTDVGNLKVGGEVAFTPRINGNPNGYSSYDYAYELTGLIDTKLRVGGTVGNVFVYGFGGYSFGRARQYWGDDYSTDGFNFGLGAQMDFGTNMFVGAEIIQRNLTVHHYNGSINSSHHVVSLRGGFKF